MGAYNHTITVNFNHAYDDATSRFIDSIDYQPAVLRVKPGDTVRWRSTFNLKICFHKGTPLDCIQVATTTVEGGYKVSEPEEVKRDAELRGYHYNVHGALEVGGQLLFFGDPGCPELIVE